MESTSERTSRVTRGISGTAMAMITVDSCAPRRDQRIASNRMPGSPSAIHHPHQHRVDAAENSRHQTEEAPMSNATTATATPTTREMRVP